MNGHVPCARLDWDSAFFGVEIARVLGEALDEAYGAEVEAWCQAAGVRCLYFLARSDDPETVVWARRLGFDLVEVRMELEWRAEKVQAVGGVREAEVRDLAALRTLARGSFVDSRFYVDGRFSREKCDELYARWVAGSSKAGGGGTLGDAVLLLEEQGQPAAFVTCKREGSVGRIGLVGVAAGMRGRGLGRQIVTAAQAWFAAAGAQRVYVVTQGRNVASQRTYQRCGFLTHKVGLYYHKWF